MGSRKLILSVGAAWGGVVWLACFLCANIFSGLSLIYLPRFRSKKTFYTFENQQEIDYFLFKLGFKFLFSIRTVGTLELYAPPNTIRRALRKRQCSNCTRSIMKHTNNRRWGPREGFGACRRQLSPQANSYYITKQY